MALDEVTVAELLRARGYATFFVGKWHLGPTAEDWSEHQGFDVNQGGHNRGGPYGGDKYFSPYGNPRLEDGPAGEHLPARLAQETCKFIAAQCEHPFLAVLSFYSVHTPLGGPLDLDALADVEAVFAVRAVPVQIEVATLADTSLVQALARTPGLTPLLAGQANVTVHADPGGLCNRNRSSGPTRAALESPRRGRVLFALRSGSGGRPAFGPSRPRRAESRL